MKRTAGRESRFEDLVLFEDDEYLFINKPPFLSSLQDRRSNTNVLGLTREYYPDAHIGHRLDKNTSGCMVIAKNDAAYRWIAGQFECRKVRKIYHAIIDGVHRFRKMGLEAPIMIKPGKSGGVVLTKGKKSLTEFNTLKSFKAHTLVECIPHSGRLHQIRIHLAHLGAPVAGDTKYGGKPVILSKLKIGYRRKKGETEFSLIGRFALHARRISFEGERGFNYDITAPYPSDFEVLLKQLAKYQ